MLTLEIFNSTLTQMLVLFCFIIGGFILRKAKILPEDSGTVISKLETYLIIPLLTINSFSKNCTRENFADTATYLLYAILLVAVALIIAVPLSKLFGKMPQNTEKENKYQSNIYSYALAFGNYGYVGNALALGLFGDTGLYKYLMFTMVLSATVYTWGMSVLIPKENQKGGVLKNFLNPPTISLFIGIALGLLNVRPHMPEFVTITLDNATACMGPLGMVLLGFVVGGYNVKELLTRGQVYIASFLRLLVIPSVMMLILKSIGASTEVMSLSLIAFAAPLGLNTVVFPSAYGGDTKTGASMAMISHTLAVITLPVMYMMWIG